MKTRLSWPAKAWGWTVFAAFYFKEILLSNFYILWDVITPEDKTRTGIIALDLPEEMSDTQVLIASNLMTMTPGTLSLELTADRKTLLVHVLYLHDVEAVRKHLMKNYVHRVLDLS